MKMGSQPDTMLVGRPCKRKISVENRVEPSGVKALKNPKPFEGC